MRKVAMFLVSVLAICLVVQPGWAQGAVRRVQITETAVSPGGEVDIHVSALGQDLGSLSGLGPGEIKVYEDGMAIPDSGLQVEELHPGLVVQILIDLSGSMQEPGVAEGETRFDSLKAVAGQFVTERLAPEDWAGVTGFHTTVVSSQTLTIDHGAVYNTIQLMQADPGQNTALLTFTSQALDRLHEEPTGKMRKVLLIFSDGKDFLEKTDQVRYREYREAVARKSKEFGIPIFAVGVGSYCGNTKGCVRSLPENEYNFEDLYWMADQTDGLVYPYLTAADGAGLTAFFDRLASQGSQYHLRYTTHAPKGDHLLKVAVTRGGEVADEMPFASPFVLPQLSLSGAIAGQEIVTDEPPLTLEVTADYSGDGLARPLSVVHFYVDDRAVFTDTTQPYTYTWEVKDYKRAQEVILRADGEDSILREMVTTLPIAVSVELTFWQKVLNFIQDHLVAIVVGLVALPLLIFLLVKRKQVVPVVQVIGQRVAQATTNLLGLQKRSLARLKVIRGDHPNREYNVPQEQSWIGREAGDILLEEGLTIHRQQHAYLQRYGTAWYITDIGKPNGVWVDNVRLAANAPAALRSGAVIRLGDVELQFIVVGATTQVI